MNKLIGFKILGVLIYYFISTVGCEMSATTLRSDSLVQFSKLNPCTLFVNAITRPCNHYNGNTPADIAQPLFSITQFILYSSTLSGSLLILAIGLGWFLLLLKRLIKLPFIPHLILMMVLFIAFAGKGQAQSQQTFTANGNFTVPAGVTSINVQAWGGGGAGGQASIFSVGKGGGGGGAYASSILAVTPGNTYNVTIGAGGTAPNQTTESTAGGSTSFDALVIAQGGNNGNNTNSSGTGGVGGLASESIGTTKFNGGNGGNGNTNSGGGGGSSATVSRDGVNGGNASGAEGGAGGIDANGDGGNGGDKNNIGLGGTFPGGGGGGRGDLGSASGEGGRGQLIIYWTCPNYAITSTSAESPVCSGNGTFVTLNSTKVSLPVGVYVVTYNLSGANIVTGNTATLTVLQPGIGTFITSAMANAGSTDITITNLASGSGFQICSNPVSTGNIKNITIILTVGTPVFILGATTTRSQGEGSVTYIATATNTTGITYSLDAESIAGGNTIVAANGSVSYVAGWSGTSIITASAAGCNEPAIASHTIMVNPSRAITPMNAAVSSDETFTATPETITNGAATITYTRTAFCKNIASDQAVTLNGTAGGTYTATPQGLSINSVTGAIIPSASTAGSYTVTYTIAASGGYEAVTANTSVTITALQVATFSYPGSSFCSDAVNQIPVYTSDGKAGKFSSTPGLVFVSAATGEINIAASLPGTYTITNKIAASGGCGAVTATYPIIINPRPTITVDYCIIAPKIRLTATGGTYEWLVPGSPTTDYIDADLARDYSVKVTNGSCVQTIKVTLLNEKVVNGDFTNPIEPSGFTSDYTYYPDKAAVNNELIPDGGTNGYGVGTNGQFYHPGFWGLDHTNNATGPRNFMLVNGHGTLVVWREGTITPIPVVPGTTYYFSAWAISLNSSTIRANLQFDVNGSTSGMSQTSTGILPARAENNNYAEWTRFYGTWKAPAGVTTAIISIVDLVINADGNDFGLDDISFGTLDPPPAALKSAIGSDDQTVCINTPIQNIIYSTERALSATVSDLPAGVIIKMESNRLTIRGNPTVAGTFPYTITLTGCKPEDITTIEGTITVIPNASMASTFALPGPFNFCVENISNAIFKDAVNINDVDISDPNDANNPRPDYYMVKPSELDLSTSNFVTNCCSSIPKIRWKITLNNSPFLPLLTYGYIEGQPSDYITSGNKIKLPGAATSVVKYIITYWLVDCNDNESVPVDVEITINPRPYIEKMQ